MDVIEFGSFYNDETQKKEKIEWEILDEDEDSFFVVSKEILTLRPFDRNGKNWGDSELRHWLNRCFYEQAFDHLEKECIRETMLDTSDCWEISTMEIETVDKIFLLSIDDTKKYFPEFALYFLEDEYKFSSAWWLRDEGGAGASSNVLILENGAYVIFVGSENIAGVRPAMRIHKNKYSLLPYELPGQISMFDQAD